MRNSSALFATIALASIAGRPAQGQSIRGRLLDAASRAPVASALAELRDGEGKVVQRTFTSPTGVFVFAAVAGEHYQLRFAAIGFARHAPIDVTGGTEPVVVPDVLVAAVAVTLPEIRAMAGKRACGRSEVNPETFGGLLESANTSLRMMDATLQQAQLGFQVQFVHTITVKTSKDSSRSADTTGGNIHSWPIRSLSLDSLKEVGFHRAGTAEEGGGNHWYGPDMQVLFSDWFLDSHCFTLDRDRSKGDTILIRFEPNGKQKSVTISGELFLDRATLTLRRLTYTHRNLPEGMPERVAGGEMRFAERSEGLWLPVDWAIWAPVVRMERFISRPNVIVMGPGTAMPRRGMVSPMSPPPLPPQQGIKYQVVGRDEMRGRLVRIVPMSG